MIAQQDISKLLADAPKSGFDYLVHFELQIKARKAFLSQNEETREKFVGIGFRIGEQTLMVEMDEVSEIVDMPKCTKVGGTKSWFLGLANVRGNLLPITDLHGFMLGGGFRCHTDRVLIYQKKGVFVGFKADDVLGLKHFFMEEKIEKQNIETSLLTPFIDEVFSRENQCWSVFNIGRFATSQEFLQIIK
jgi:twitching motility protein PilI